MVPLTTVEPTRLYRKIAEQIAALIDSGAHSAIAARMPVRQSARRGRERNAAS